MTLPGPPHRQLDDDLLSNEGRGARGPGEQEWRHHNPMGDPEPSPPACVENHDFGMVWRRCCRRRWSGEGGSGEGQSVVRCGQRGRPA